MNAESLDQQLLVRIEALAVRWVQEAGQVAMRRFQRPMEVEYKQENRADPVTEVDRGIEALLRSHITAEFPDHAVLGEEGTDIEVARRDFVWVLDPVDGTTNFVNGLPLFACSAALLFKGSPVAGAIFLPVAARTAGVMSCTIAGGEEDVSSLQIGSGVLHARLGGGAFLDADPVKASDAPVPESSSLTGMPGHHARQFQRRDKLRANPGELRSLGSVCYETAMVASGVFRYSLFRRPKLWDVAAGAIIVPEAGGLCLAWLDGEWRPVTRFEPMANPRKPEERGLRFWATATLMGGSRVASFVADRLTPRARPASRRGS
jgi:myo-inositol-1(or 4)-monophosphatase